MGLSIVTQPASEPVSLTEAKLHLRVDFTDDDALIGSLITAARQICERELARSFIQTSWRQTMDRFPWPTVNAGTGQTALGWQQLCWTPERVYPSTSEPIRLLRAPLIEVTAFQYVDQNGILQTLDPSLYQVQLDEPPKVVPAYNTTWPAARVQPDSIQISFNAGYGTDETTTPPCIQAAIKLLLDIFYNNRGADVASMTELPWGVKALLACEEWGLYV